MDDAIAGAEEEVIGSGTDASNVGLLKGIRL